MGMVDLSGNLLSETDHQVIHSSKLEQMTA